MTRQSRGSQLREFTLREGDTSYAEEFTVETDGMAFGIIFGECALGHFIALPQYGVSVPAGAATDTHYNYERLHGCKNQFVKDNAKTLAVAIAAYCGKDDK